MPASFDVPTSPLTQLRQSQHNARLIANRFIASAVIPQVNYQTEDITASLQEPLDQLVENFFRVLAEFLGTEEDLISQLPGTPGLRPWNPLNLDYVKEKGTAAFWLYTMAPKVQGHRHSAISILRGADARRATLDHARDINNTLINTFKGLSGLQTFGGAEITYQPPGEATIQVEKRGGRGRRKVLSTYVRNVTTIQEVAAYKIDVRIRLWSDITAAQLSQIERVMTARGSISQQILRELTNPRGSPRPLIRPFMAYYSNVRVPAIIREVLAKFSPDLGNVLIQGNRASGFV